MLNLRTGIFTSYCLTLLLLIGCSSSEKAAPVKGKLTKGGQTYKFERAPGAPPMPPGDNPITIQFKRIGGPENYESFAIVNMTEMSFTVPGNNGQGVPPGEYEVIVLAKTGEKDAKPKGPSASPMGSSLMEGKEIARVKVTIPDAGKTDLEIAIK
jgi:hypothetical protein